MTKLGIKNFKQSFLSLCYKKVTKCYSRRRQLENSNVEFSRSFNVKVSAEVGTGRYCLWGRSYQEIVYRMVPNSKFTNQGLSSKRFKLLNVTPVQIKPTLFANDREFLGVASFSLILHFGDFLIGLPRRRRRRRRRRSTPKTSVTHTCCTVQGNKYDV